MRTMARRSLKNQKVKIKRLNGGQMKHRKLTGNTISAIPSVVTIGYLIKVAGFLETVGFLLVFGTIIFLGWWGQQIAEG